jgi:hypothetical protein
MELEVEISKEDLIKKVKSDIEKNVWIRMQLGNPSVYFNGFFLAVRLYPESRLLEKVLGDVTEELPLKTGKNNTVTIDTKEYEQFLNKVIEKGMRLSDEVQMIVATLRKIVEKKGDTK